MASKTPIIQSTESHEPLNPADKIVADIEFLNPTGILATPTPVTNVYEAINRLKEAIEALP